MPVIAMGIGFNAPNTPNTDSPTFTGTVTLPSTTSIGSVSDTELGYLDGVTSSIQTQINSKANTDSPTFTGTPTAPTAAIGTNTTQLATTAFVQSSIQGRNVLINGSMAIDQRNSGAAQTITAGAALAYTIDRWYAYCTGANVTGQQVQGASQNLFRYRFTGAASNTSIQFGQRIEALNSAHLAGTTCTLSVDLANSLLTTVRWTAFYANTTDSFGTIASPTRTQIATGTFTVNSIVTRYSTQISIPAAATTGIEIVFSVVNQTSGTWTIGDVQLEPGTVATPFERRSYGQELALCQRYYEETGTVGWTGRAVTTTQLDLAGSCLVEKRTLPSLVVASSFQVRVNSNNITLSGVVLSSSNLKNNGALLVLNITSGTMSAGNFIHTNATSSPFKFLAEL